MPAEDAADHSTEPNEPRPVRRFCLLDLLCRGRRSECPEHPAIAIWTRSTPRPGLRGLWVRGLTASYSARLNSSTCARMSEMPASANVFISAIPARCKPSSED